MPSETVKIPHDRVGALIGPQGSTKKIVEKKGKVRIEVDSESGEVEIKGRDPVKVLKSQHVVKAIGRGFSPEKAFKLFEDDFMLDIIELDLSGSKKELENIRGRIIGTQGKARQKIEEETHSFISVYGKTVSIIAKMDDIQNTRKGLEMLLRGASHSRVYSILKRMDSKKFELV